MYNFDIGVGQEEWGLRFGSWAAQSFRDGCTVKRRRAGGRGAATPLLGQKSATFGEFP